MKNNTLIKSSLFMLLIFCSAISLVSHAQSSARYISDVLYIPLRTGMGNEYEVAKAALISGTKLTLIREEEDNRNELWSLVQMSDGTQGWIRSQHLVSEPTAAIKLERVTAQFKNASASVKDAAEQQKLYAQLQEEHSALQQEFQDLSKNMESLRQTSASAINIEQENQKIHESNQLLQTRVDFLQAENEHLKDADRNNQRLYGAGLLLCGVLLSFFLQALGKRKRQSEWR